jgi:hypothetical protein
VNTTLKKFINLHVEVDENKGRRFFKVIFLEKEKIANTTLSNRCVICYIGQSYLSGTAATTWYFNPDIPEAQEYYIK